MWKLKSAYVSHPIPLVYGIEEHFYHPQLKLKTFRLPFLFGLVTMYKPKNGVQFTRKYTLLFVKMGNIKEGQKQQQKRKEWNAKVIKCHEYFICSVVVYFFGCFCGRFCFPTVNFSSVSILLFFFYTRLFSMNILVVLPNENVYCLLCTVFFFHRVIYAFIMS